MKKVLEKQNYSNGVKSETISQLVNSAVDIVFRTKPKKTALVLNAFFNPFLIFVIIWVLFDTGIILGIIFSGVSEDLPWIWAGLIPFFLLHMTPVWLHIINTIKAGVYADRIQFAFTDSAIYLQGVTAKGRTVVKVVRFEDITSIELRKGVIDRMCKVGDIFVDGNLPCRFNDMPNPEEAYKKLRALIANRNPIISGDVFNCHDHNR